MHLNHKYFAIREQLFELKKPSAANIDNLLNKSTPLIFNKYATIDSETIVRAIIIIPGEAINTELIVCDLAIL